MYLYLTGSASWYIYTILEEVLGIKFSLGAIHLEPKLTAGDFFNHSIKAKFAWDETIVWVTYQAKTKKRVYCMKEVFLEGTRIPLQAGACSIKKDALPKGEAHLVVQLG